MQQKADGLALRRMLAADYLLVGSGGAVETKEASTDELTSPNYRMNLFKVS